MVRLLLFALLGACIPEAARQRAVLKMDLGTAYLREANIPGAVMELEAAVDADPRSAPSWSKLSLAYLAAAVPQKALVAGQKAARLAPTDGEIQTNYGIVLYQNGKYTEAEAAFRTAAADLTYRSPALALSNLGYLLVAQGRPAEAVPVLNDAIRRAPHLCEARFNRGLAYRELSQARPALEDFEAVITLCGADAAGAYLEAGRLLLQGSDRNGACTYFLTAAETGSGSEIGDTAGALHAEACSG
jgi:Tfp pilus assembly protein PilF